LVVLAIARPQDGRLISEPPATSALKVNAFAVHAHKLTIGDLPLLVGATIAIPEFNLVAIVAETTGRVHTQTSLRDCPISLELELLIRLSVAGIADQPCAAYAAASFGIQALGPHTAHQSYALCVRTLHSKRQHTHE
jgi:hypothetical protein